MRVRAGFPRRNLCFEMICHELELVATKKDEHTARPFLLNEAELYFAFTKGTCWRVPLFSSTST